MKYLILFFFVLASSIFPQSYYSHLFLPTGFTVESLSGYGYSKTMGGAENIAAMNPAAIDRFSSPSAGFSYQFETKIDPAYLANMPVKRYRTNIPQSAGLILPYRNMRLGIGFTQRYDGDLILEKVAVTTVENPDGTGEFMRFEEKADVYRISGILSYGVNDLFMEGDRVTAGVSFDYDYINYFTDRGMAGHAPDFQMKSHGDKTSAAFGLMYSPSKSTVYSLSYEESVEFSKMKVDSYIDNRMYYFIEQPIGDFAVSREPSRIHLGFDHRFGNQTTLTSTLSYVSWNGAIGNRRDRAEASFSLIFPVHQLLTVSGGVFYTDYDFTSDTEKAFDLGTKYNALYLTAGLIFSWNIIDVNISAGDSHLTGGAYRKHAVARAGAGIHL
ncbi:MAG: hypothetical protein ACM3Q2_15945 [Syntrophothermus sp.]